MIFQRDVILCNNHISVKAFLFPIMPLTSYPFRNWCWWENIHCFSGGLSIRLDGLQGFNSVPNIAHAGPDFQHTLSSSFMSCQGRMIVNGRYGIWAQVGVTRSCALPNIMGGQGQGKGRLSYKHGEEGRDGGNVLLLATLWFSYHLPATEVSSFSPFQLSLWCWQGPLHLFVNVSLFPVEEEDKHVFKREHKGSLYMSAE